MLSSHYSTRATNLDHLSSRFPSLNGETPWRSNEHLKHEHEQLHKLQEPWLGQTRQNPTEVDSLKLQIHNKIHEKSPNSGQVMMMSQSEREGGLKRKALDAELDLNLSLGLDSRNGDITDDDDDDGGDDEQLVLSLYTVREGSSKDERKKMKEERIVVGNEKARGASTLDLTL